MKANESNFSFIREESVIEIPFFQRAYVWKQEQWKQFFNDLKESFENKQAAECKENNLAKSEA